MGRGRANAKAPNAGGNARGLRTNPGSVGAAREPLSASSDALQGQSAGGLPAGVWRAEHNRRGPPTPIPYGHVTGKLAPISAPSEVTCWITSLFAPLAPYVHWTLAIPFVSVTPVAGFTEPPPSVTFASNERSGIGTSPCVKNCTSTSTVAPGALHPVKLTVYTRVISGMPVAVAVKTA